MKDGECGCELSIYFRTLHEVFLGCSPGDVVPSVARHHVYFALAALLGHVWWLTFLVVEGLWLLPWLMPDYFGSNAAASARETP